MSVAMESYDNMKPYMQKFNLEYRLSQTIHNITKADSEDGTIFGAIYKYKI